MTDGQRTFFVFDLEIVIQHGQSRKFNSKYLYVLLINFPSQIILIDVLSKKLNTRKIRNKLLALCAILHKTCSSEIHCRVFETRVGNSLIALHIHNFISTFILGYTSYFWGIVISLLYRPVYGSFLDSDWIKVAGNRHVGNMVCNLSEAPYTLTKKPKHVTHTTTLPFNFQEKWPFQSNKSNHCCKIRENNEAIQRGDANRIPYATKRHALLAVTTIFVTKNKLYGTAQYFYTA